MTNYDDQLDKLHSDVTLRRSIEYILRTPRFIYCYNKTENHNKINKLIETCNKEGILKWIEDNEGLVYEEMGMIKLREIAKEKKIHNYSRLSKIELIRSLRHEENS